MAGRPERKASRLFAGQYQPIDNGVVERVVRSQAMPFVQAPTDVEDSAFQILPKPKNFDRAVRR